MSIGDFKDYYWYKAELIEYCRAEKLIQKGSKIDLSKRIEKYLATGEKEKYWLEMVWRPPVNPWLPK